MVFALPHSWYCFAYLASRLDANVCLVGSGFVAVGTWIAIMQTTSTYVGLSPFPLQWVFVIWFRNWWFPKRVVSPCGKYYAITYHGSMGFGLRSGVLNDLS